LGLNLRVDDWPAPESIEPSQFFEQPEERPPEHRLLLALLNDAVLCLLAARGQWISFSSKENLRTEAMRWVSGYPAKITFNQCCETLGLDTAQLRKALLHAADRSRWGEQNVSPVNWRASEETDGGMEPCRPRDCSKYSLISPVEHFFSLFGVK